MACREKKDALVISINPEWKEDLAEEEKDFSLRSK